MKKWRNRLTFRIPFFSTGKPFDPGEQKRTDAVDDLVKQQKDSEKIKKLFDKKD